MSRTRYLLLLPRTAEARARWLLRLQALQASVPGACWALTTGQVLALALGSLHRPIADHGLLVGSVFGGASDLAANCGPSDFDRLRDRLTSRCWGGYVAVVADSAGGQVHVMRAPLGDLACYWTVQDGAALVASDLALLQAAGVPRPGVDAAALCRFLIAEDLRTSETCLTGIAELRGGECLTFGVRDVERTVSWSPWTFARRDDAVDDVGEARELVREAALKSVAAVAASERNPIVKLSGGLDSSILSACLKAAGISFTAVNLVTRDVPGDERRYARRVAESLEIPLVARVRDVARVSLDRSEAARLPRPSARSFTQDTARICAEVAESRSSTALLDGGGGDNVFCSLQSARPAADSLLQWKCRTFFKTAASISRLAQASIFRVAGHAVRIAARRSPAYRWELDSRLLSGSARQELENVPAHPWLAPPGGILPGKAGHVALLAAAQSVVEGFDAESPLPSFSPLLAQPLVEACLRVPSWLWFDDGLNRAVARRAFSGYLPREIVERRSKGGPDCFIAELYERSRPFLSDLLLGGELARLDVIDRTAVGNELRGDGPARGTAFLRVMRLADAEAWVRCWC